MTFWPPLIDILILLAVALALGLLFERLGQSAILGYLVAGTLLGPGALNLISSETLILTLAELGAALLLFSIGLEFSRQQLRGQGPVAVVGGSLQMWLTTALGAAVGLALGLEPAAAVAVGAIVAPSSTTYLLRMLSERAELDSIHGRHAAGITVMQEIAVVPLVMIVVALGTRGSGSQVFSGLGQAIGLAVVLVAAFYLISNYVLSRLFDLTAASRNRELVIILAAVTCLAAALTAQWLRFSPALGAFVAGVLLAESPFAAQIRADVGSLRTLFVTLFFASVGMVADLGGLTHNPVPAVLAALAILAGKTLVVWPLVRTFGVSTFNSLASGLCLSMGGEFSFVLAQIALAHQVISGDLFKLLISSILITLFLTPYLTAQASRVARLGKELPRGLPFSGLPWQAAGQPGGHAVVVGFGPAGRRVAQTIRAAGAPVVVIDLNPKTVAAAEEAGYAVTIGDARQEHILRHVGAPSASVVVVTVPDHRSAVQIVGQARAIAPEVVIIARARYNIYAGELKGAGADEVADEEQEIGKLLGWQAKKHLPRGS